MTTAPAEVWPFQPDAPLKETLEWKTDVLQSETGEQRLALRAAPRQMFNFTTTLDETYFGKAREFNRLYGATTFAFPVWPEQTKLGASLSAAATSISFSTANASYTDGGYILIWDSPDNYEFALLDSVASGSVVLSAGLSNSYQNPIVAPCRTCIVDGGGFSFTRSGPYFTVTANVIATDNAALSGTSPYPSYGGFDVLTDEPVTRNNLTENVIRAATYVDNGFGLISMQPTKTYVDFGQTISFIDAWGSELWARRTWLHSLKGMQKTFWLPTFANELVLAANILSTATTIDVESIGATALYTSRHIMIELKSGTRYFRAVSTAAHESGGIDRMAIDSALGAGVTASDIAQFCFLSLVRLNADAVTITHNDGGYAETAIPVIEVPA